MGFKNAFFFIPFIIITFFFIFKYIPTNYLIPNKYKIENAYLPSMFLEGIKDFRYENEDVALKFEKNKIKVSIGPLGYFLIIENQNPYEQFTDVKSFLEWIDSNRKWIENNINIYGGILFRGFSVKTPIDFDNIVAHLNKDKNGTGIYLGTAPRNKIQGTRFVSTASDIKRFITIPTHIELSFTPNPPRNLYFFAEKPNKPVGGQTTLTDFRQVWKEIPLQLRDKLYSKGMKYERRYYNRNYSRPIDMLQTKSWQDMFKTENKSKVEEMSLSQEFFPHWDDKDNLLLIHYANVNRTHPVTNEPYWSTHFNVLHAPTYAVPYAWSAQLFDSKESAIISIIFDWILRIRNYLGYPYGHNMVYSDDDSEILWDEAILIRKIISKNTWIVDWKAQDLMMIDNHRIAHGRSPWFEGGRKVYVAWG